MKTHGLDTAVRSSHHAARRRFTVSVILADGPIVAARLIGWLKWRGFAFDRVVAKPDGENPDIMRIVFTLTTCLEGGRLLMETIGRYGPVEAVRQFYAAPIVGTDHDGEALPEESTAPVLCDTPMAPALCNAG